MSRLTYRRISLAWFLGFVVAASGALWAQESTPPTPGADAPPEVPQARRSARATVRTFLDALDQVKAGREERMADAVACLDLSQVSEFVRGERGAELAWMLLEVMDRTQKVLAWTISDAADGPPYVFHRYEGAGEVAVARSAGGEWLFTRETVAAIPALFDMVSASERVEGLTGAEGYLSPSFWLRQKIPKSLRKVVFLIETWQWAGLFLLILLGFVFDRLLTYFLGFLVRRLMFGHSEGAGQAGARAARPMGLLAMAAWWWVGLSWLGLPDTAYGILLVAVKFLSAASAVWTAYRLVDVLAGYLQSRALATETKFDDLLVPMVRKSCKVFVTAFGLVFIADNLNVNITSLLAGIGLAGMAFALAAKETVENFFGSLTVLLDRPFHIGDWVKIDGVEGTVEEVGFRSTRLRTFYNSLVTLPNAKLIRAVVDNMGLRRYRRVSCKLGLVYSTPPEKVDAFCEGIRELIRRHPYTRKDYYHVYFNEFDVSSLNVMLYCFHETPDWGTELRERHRLFLDILRLARDLGVDFAFPTQTLFLERGGGGDDGTPTPEDVEAAERLGRTQAAEIVRRTLGDPVHRPPPVRILPPDDPDPLTQRRDGSNGDGDGGG